MKQPTNNMEYMRCITKGEYPDNPRVPIGNTIEDERGAIMNLTEIPVSHIAIICSKKGTTRSNHYHKNNWHILYVIYGSMLYCERNLDGTDKKTFMVNTGQMVFTAPGKVHQTYFEQDTTLINICKMPKTKSEHREDCIHEDF